MTIDDPLLESSDLDELQALLEAQVVKAGTVVDGTIESVDGAEVRVGVPEAGAAVVPVSEFAVLGETPAAGDPVRIYVDWVAPDGLRLSRQKAAGLDLWASFEAAAIDREPIEGVVLATTRGGYSVDIGTKAFLADNDLAPGDRRGVELIGETLELFVHHADSRKTKLKLSQSKPRSAPAHRLEEGEDVFDCLEVGQSVVGVVARLTDFGAFVDIGGFDGLLHVNDMSYGRVNHPREVVHVGDEIVVKVLKLDEDARRVGLGLKQLSPDPWTVAADRYRPDMRVSGRVISVTNYGAFIEVEPGLEGLVHVSEMSWKRVNHPKDAVKKGQLVEAAVIRCDPEQQRLKLSMKAVEPNPWEVVAERYPVGSRLTGKIRNVRDFGVFVGVEDGIDGLVHISDLAWGNAVRRPSDHFQRGQEIETLVLEVDVDRERISLGIKQLSADPTRAFFDDHAIGDIVSGRVTGLAEFGAFVQVAEGLDGLVHISELSHEPVEHTADAVKKGQEVQVMVLGLDAEVPKVSLSLKAALPEPGGEEEKDGGAAETPAQSASEEAPTGAGGESNDSTDTAKPAGDAGEGVTEPHDITEESDVASMSATDDPPAATEIDEADPE